MRGMILLCLVLILPLGAYGKEVFKYSNEQLADAVYKAEGWAKTRYPYGILTKYKHTTPRQACLNTIKSAHKRYASYNGDDDFVTFLGRTYCPVGAKNDPTGLNKHWVKNVKYFLGKQ